MDVKQIALNVCLLGYSRSIRSVIQMTNRQWLMWRLIDMTNEELIKEFPGFMCDVCASHILIVDKPCPIDCGAMLLSWLQQEHKECVEEGRE